MYNKKAQMMDRDEIKEKQEEKMMKMVRYAYNNVPMYKKKFKEENITPDDINSLKDVHKIPFTVKDDLREHYPYGILAVPREDVVRFHASSGTTGTPTVVGYTRNDMETWSDLMARCYSAAGADPGDIVQNAYGYGLFTGGLGFHQGAETLGASVLPTSTGNTKKQITMLNDFQTSVLASTPSYALYLSEAAKKHGYDPLEDFNLDVGMFGAEPWSEEARESIEESMGLRAHDVYGMSELYGPGVAIECPEQNGLHIWSDEFLVETIDPETGEVLPEGEKGELVFTMLSREAMPLLRYRTKDIATVEYGECECGRSHPRIMRVTGRSDDMLIVGGVNVFPSQVEAALLETEGIGEYFQIIVDRDVLDKLSIRVEVDKEYYGSDEYDEEDLLERAHENLQAILNIKSDVELLEPGELPRTVGKAKKVVDLREED
ncbi:MAG: phenylacetate--CoA ligase [Candidatus Thermoplasmatota archaeon]|nr:phenylacetate--CoA ligase [Candidatus Thermoplasmatota archaeon]